MGDFRRPQSGVLLLVLLALGGLSSCGPAEPYKILFLGPLTGPNAGLGVDGQKGAQLAVLEVNQAGGIQNRRVELVVLDDEGDPEKGLGVLKSQNLDQFEGVILHTTSGAAVEDIPYLNEQKVLTFSRTVSSPQWSGQDDYFIRFAGNTQAFGRDLGRLALEKSITRLGVVFETNNQIYAQAINQGVREVVEPQIQVLEPQGFETWEAFESGTGAQALLGEKIDGLLLVASGLNSAKAAQYLLRKKMTIPLLLSPWAHNPVLAEYSGEYAGRIELLGTTDPQAQSPDYQKFLKTYEERIGASPTNFAIFGYEVTQFCLQSLAENPSAGKEQRKAQVLAKGQFQGLQDLILVDRYGDATYQTYHMGIREGEFFVKKKLSAP